MVAAAPDQAYIRSKQLWTTCHGSQIVSALLGLISIVQLACKRIIMPGMSNTIIMSPPPPPLTHNYFVHKYGVQCGPKAAEEPKIRFNIVCHAGNCAMASLKAGRDVVLLKKMTEAVLARSQLAELSIT